MFQKIKDFYLKHKMLLAVVIILPLVLACNYCIEICFAAVPLMLLFFITCSFGEMIETIFFFMAFSSVSPFYTSMLIAAIVVTTIKYIIDVKNKKEKIFKLPLIVSGLLAILFTVVFYTVDMEGFYNWALAMGLLFGFYYSFVYYKQIKISKCIYLLTFGLILSAALSGIVLIFKIPGYKVVLFDGVYNRARFFMKHVNHLSMFSLFAIAFLIYGIVQESFHNLKELFSNKKVILNLILIVIISVLGLFSLSKAFILVLVIMFVYLTVIFIVNLKLESMYIIVPALVVLVGLGFVFKDYILVLVNRFTAYYTSTSLLNQIFTNRNVVWTRYLNATLESPLKILFGVGMLSADLGTGPHSVLIHLFFRSGAIGLILIGVLIWSYCYSSSSKLKLTHKNILPIFVWCLLSLEEMILSDRFFLFLVMGIILLINQCTTTNSNNIK